MKIKLSMFSNITWRGLYFVPSLILGLILGVSVYNYILVSYLPPFSGKIILFTIAIILLGAAGYYYLLTVWILPTLARMKPLEKWLSFGLATLTGIFLMAAGTNLTHSSIENIVFLLPDKTVRIFVPKKQLVANPEIILQFFFTTAGDVSFNSIEYKGWTRQDNKLVLTDLADNSFKWVGKTGQKATMILLRSQQGGYINVDWGGFTETVNLYLDKNDKYSYTHYYSIPFYASKEMALILASMNFIVLCLALILFVWGKKEKFEKILSASIPPLSDFVQAQPDGYDRSKMEKAGNLAILIGIIVIAFLLRIFFLGQAYLYLDEFSHLEAARSILSGVSLASVYQRSLFLVTMPMVFFIKYFGFTLWFARLPGVLFNVLAIIPLYLALEKINRRMAILSCLLYATNPWLIAVSRNIREYAYYPFYFYWIVYGMIIYLEKIPNQFVIFTDWMKLFSRRMVFLAAMLLLPLIYGIFIDVSSTFRVVLIAYVVFFIFVLGKFKLTDKSNVLFIGVMTVCIAVISFFFLSRQLSVSFSPSFNSYPIRFFFPNPQQQWYYNRLVIVFALAFVTSLVLSVYVYRKNFIPLFFFTLFLVSAIAFIVLFDRYIRPRYIINVQFWFIPLLGIGLYGLWSFIQPVFSKGWIKLLIVLAFLCLSINVGQILLPSVYNKPGFMPITDEYEYNFEAVDALVLKEAKQNDVMVGTIYPKYAFWRGVPGVNILDSGDIFGIDLQKYIYSSIERYDSGWIVLDIRSSSKLLPRSTFQVKDRVVEYVGLMDEELVWKWK